MGREDGEVGEGSRGGQTPKHSSASGGATPRRDSQRQNSPDGGLKPRPGALRSLSRSGSRSGSRSRPGSRSGSRANSRARSPALSERREDDIEEGEDATMADALKVRDADNAPDTPMAGADTQLEGTAPRVEIHDAIEEAVPEEGEAEDKMDTT